MSGGFRNQLAACVLVALAGLLAAGSDQVTIQTVSPATIELTTGRQRVFRSAERIQRTAVADPTVCDVNIYSTSEFAIIPRAAGQTDVTFWFHDSQRPPQTYIVEVK